MDQLFSSKPGAIDTWFGSMTPCLDDHTPLVIWCTRHPRLALATGCCSLVIALLLHLLDQRLEARKPPQHTDNGGDEC